MMRDSMAIQPADIADPENHPVGINCIQFTEANADGSELTCVWKAGKDDMLSLRHLEEAWWRLHHEMLRRIAKSNKVTP